jgi:hypothetical protein
MDPLTTSLLDLLYELRGHGLPLTVGGGFGLFLKRRHLQAAAGRTLFDRLPEVRSTNDVDLFIRAEILADAARTRAIADAIRRLGYEPVEEAKFLQWRRPVQVGGVPQEVRMDLLVGPLGAFRGRLHVKGQRARPKGQGIEFHAHCTEEAIGVEESPVAVTVAGMRSNGEPSRDTVFVPEAFPYLMMKLHAFDDRKQDEDKDVGRHHALDLYTVVGLMTEVEYERGRGLGRGHAGDPHVRRARAIVKEHFSERSGLGVLRLREHKLFRPDLQVEEFMAELQGFFPG